MLKFVKAGRRKRDRTGPGEPSSTSWSFPDRILRPGTAAVGRWTARLCLAGALGAAAPASPDVLRLHPERTSKNMLGADTRGGQLVAMEVTGGWRVTLGNRIVLDGAPLGATRMRLLTVATGRDADHVVVLVNTSTDCAVRFAVVAVGPRGQAVASPPFGSCADLSALSVDRDGLVFTMPGRPGADGTTASLTFRYAGGAVTGPFPL